MNTPEPEPTPEAVEAAIVFIDGQGRIHWNEAACLLLSMATDEDHESGCPQTFLAARILAAEVRRLCTELDKRGTEYAKALNRRVDVENVLYQVAAGKRVPLTQDECRELANKLGVSPA